MGVIQRNNWRILFGSNVLYKWILCKHISPKYWRITHHSFQ